MKVLLVFFVATVVLQTSYAQCIRSLAPNLLGVCGCGCEVPSCAPSNIACPCPALPATIVQSNTVAASLADTLSLLTVSSLLADTLPYGCNMCVAPGGYCGGCGGNCGGCGGYCGGCGGNCGSCGGNCGSCGGYGICGGYGGGGCNCIYY